MNHKVNTCYINLDTVTIWYSELRWNFDILHLSQIICKYKKNVHFVYLTKNTPKISIKHS